MSDDDKRELSSEISAISNRPTSEDTRPLLRDDYGNWVIARFDLEATRAPAMHSWSFSQKEKWARSRLLRQFNYYFSSRTAELTSVIKIAFDPGTQSSINNPSEKTMDLEFQKFFSNSPWNPNGTKNVMQRFVCTNPQIFRGWLNDEMLGRSIPTQARPEVWLCVKVGASLKADTRKVQTVIDKRKEFLEEVRDFNNNPNAINAGQGIVKRIMFIQQLTSGSYVAYEWNIVSQDFDLV
jgi:hypothetical protein